MYLLWIDSHMRKGCGWFSRLYGVDQWLQNFCFATGHSLICNFYSFWARRDLFRNDNLHHNRRGTSLLENRFISHIISLSTDWLSTHKPPNPGPVSDIPILLSNRPHTHLPHRSINMDNLSLVHCSCTIMANNQLEHISFALLSVRSLANKSLICNDLITS